MPVCEYACIDGSTESLNMSFDFDNKALKKFAFVILVFEEVDLLVMADAQEADISGFNLTIKWAR